MLKSRKVQQKCCAKTRTSSTCGITSLEVFFLVHWAGLVFCVWCLLVSRKPWLQCCLLLAACLMCKHFCDTAQVYPYSLYDSVLAAEGHSRIHTWLFISSICRRLTTPLFTIRGIKHKYLMIQKANDYLLNFDKVNAE